MNTDIISRGLAAGALTNAEAALPSALMASLKRIEQRIPLTSGAIYMLPEGYIDIFDIGPFLTLQRYSYSRAMWLTVRASGMASYPPFYSTGTSHRIVNAVNCVSYGVILTPGSGYSQSNPPTIVPNVSGYASGKATPAKVRATVGGAITLNIVNQGTYDLTPTIVINGYELQTPPFRQAQINPRLDSNGHITSFNYDGNFTSAAAGSTGGYSGAGLDHPELLTVTVVRHPDDTQTDNAILTASAAGADQVTNLDVLHYGNAVGDRDATATITHNGGSGLSVALGVNHYITQTTIADGGIYLNTYSDRGASSGSNTSTTLNDATKSWAVNQWAGYYVRILDGPCAGFVGLIASNTASVLTITQKHPTASATWSITPESASYEIASGVTSSTANDSYLGLLLCGGFLDDEQARPLYSGGICTLTNGVITTAKISGAGPFLSARPKLAIAPSGGVRTIARHASIVPVLGKGGDYFSYYRWPTR